MNLSSKIAHLQYFLLFLVSLLFLALLNFTPHNEGPEAPGGHRRVCAVRCRRRTQTNQTYKNNKILYYFVFCLGFLHLCDSKRASSTKTETHHHCPFSHSSRVPKYTHIHIRALAYHTTAHTHTQVTQLHTNNCTCHQKSTQYCSVWSVEVCGYEV